MWYQEQAPRGIRFCVKSTRLDAMPTATAALMLFVNEYIGLQWLNSHSVNITASHRYTKRACSGCSLMVIASDTQTPPVVGGNGDAKVLDLKPLCMHYDFFTDTPVLIKGVFPARVHESGGCTCIFIDLVTKQHRNATNTIHIPSLSTYKMQSLDMNAASTLPSPPPRWGPCSSLHPI